MKKIIIFMVLTGTIACCTGNQKKTEGFSYSVDRFADIEVLRYQVP